MDEEKFRDELERLTNAISRLEVQRCEESAKKKDLQEKLKRLKDRTV